MSEKVKLTIDGKEVTVDAGATILDAAEQAGIHIPNLCYLKGMKGIGACRMCLVEIEGMKAPMTACTARVKDGMVVRTTNEQIEEIRKYVIDLILSMHPLDCMTCTKAGVCQLQKYAYDLEIKESSFTRKKFGFDTDEGNPFIKRDPDYCILCARCVRVCKEQGTSVLDFYGRGVGARVTTAQDRPLHEAGCTFCGSCLDACPVNAILEADRWRRGREWDYERVESTCLFCGNACSTQVSTYRGDVAKVNAAGDRGRIDYFICAYGRYGFDYINGDTRVLEPLKRIDGELKPVSWTQAIEDMARALMDDKNSGIITAGNLLNEEYLTIRRFADEAGINNIDTTVSAYADEASLLGPEVDINEADCLVVVGLNPSQWDRVHASLDASLRRAKARGAKLIVINSEDTGLAEAADVAIKTSETEALSALAKALKEQGEPLPKGMSLPDVQVSEEMNRVAELYLKASNPVVVSSPVFFEASVNVALIKGSALSVPIEANAKGAMLMGIKGSGKSYQEMASEGLKILYVIGDVAMKRPAGVEMLIVQNSHMTELAREADLVIPSTTFFESNGTVVDYMGGLKSVRAAIEPFAESKTTIDIIKALSKKMGLKVKPATSSDVKKQIKAFKVELKPSEFKARQDLTYNPSEFIPQTLATMVHSSRLLWLKEMQSQTA